MARAPMRCFESVETAIREILFREVREFARQRVVEHGVRHAVRVAHAHDVQDAIADGKSE